MTSRPSSRCWHAAALVLAMTLLAARPAAAGPVTFHTALPIHDGEVVVRQQVLWRRCSRGGPPERRLDELSFPTVFVYGVHERITAFAIVPLLHRRLRMRASSGSTATRATTGLGDVTGLWRVTLLQIDRPGETLRLAPFGGLKLPTGVDDQHDRFGRIPRGLQLGTGSWDPLAGIILTWQTLSWQLDASASYQRRSRAKGFKAGDEARADVSFQYRVVPWGELGGGIPSFVYAVVESNAIWTARDVMGRRTNPDSGGATWYLAPALQWVTRRTVLEAAVQLPVWQKRNGNALRTDFIARVSFRASF